MSNTKNKADKSITLLPEQILIIENSLRVVMEGLSEELSKAKSKLTPKLIKTTYQDTQALRLLSHPTVLELVANSTGLPKDILLQYQFQVLAASQVAQAKQKRVASSQGGRKGGSERLANSRALKAAEEFIRREPEAADRGERAALLEKCATDHFATVAAVRHHIRRLKK